MPVYILEESWDYEGSSVVGVFGTLARAKHCAEDRNKIGEWEAFDGETFWKASQIEWEDHQYSIRLYYVQ